MEPIELATTYRCPSCGKPLELLEDRDVVWFGCVNCWKYVRENKRELARRFVDYRGRKFLWSDMLEVLYSNYVYGRPCGRL
ncbi:MAG: hypothetical protein ACK4M3_04520 [Pyrobaculum sp.]